MQKRDAMLHPVFVITHRPAGLKAVRHPSHKPAGRFLQG
jgi:hypothetical protein